MECKAPDFINADFCIIVPDDSMINARLFVGDIVYIRQQDTVDDGQIAAVLIGDCAHLGRIWNMDNGFMLKPENPMYRPRTFYHQDNEARIVGRAVGASITLT